MSEMQLQRGWGAIWEDGVIKKGPVSLFQKDGMPKGENKKEKVRGGECKGGTGKSRRQSTGLLYLDGPGFQGAPFLRLLMLFYGNLLGLLITENRTHILKTKS